MLTGERVVLFLDKDALRWGEAWRDTIDLSLASVPFFFTILNTDARTSGVYLVQYHGGADRTRLVFEQYVCFTVTRSGIGSAGEPRDRARTSSFKAATPATFTPSMRDRERCCSGIPRGEPCLRQYSGLPLGQRPDGRRGLRVRYWNQPAHISVNGQRDVSVVSRNTILTFVLPLRRGLEGTWAIVSTQTRGSHVKQ